MAVTHGHGNPKWTRDETVLALDLYLDCGTTLPSANDQRVRELSDLLRSIPLHDLSMRKETFRNPAGVAFKLQNLHQVATGKGLENSSRTDEATWREFAGRLEFVKPTAALIREAIHVGTSADEMIGDPWEFSEGRLITNAHKRRERHPGLRAKLISARLKKGALNCDICSLRPRHPYGDAIYEAHHIVPLGVAGERSTRIADLALLCANCHRIVHRAIAEEKRWLTVEEARGLVLRSEPR